MSESVDTNTPESCETKRKSMNTSPENYLNELASIAKCIKRLEDFVGTLEI